MSNDSLVKAVEAAMTDPAIESHKHYCSRFVRQCCERVYGSRYDSLFGATAIQTGYSFLDAGLGFYAGPGVVMGDVLFKLQGSGGAGHVGVLTPLGVGENSSTPIGRISGAKGYRSLDQFGHFDAVGRLPDPATPSPPQPIAYKFFINTVLVAVCPVQSGHAVCPVRAFGQALSLDVDWDEQASLPVLAGHVLSDAIAIGGRAFAPVRELAAISQHSISVDDATRAIYLFTR